MYERDENEQVVWEEKKVSLEFWRFEAVWEAFFLQLRFKLSVG